MADVQLLKDALRLYKQALQQTPGGTATLGRLALKQPDLLARLMAYESAPAAGVGATSTDQEWKDFQAWQEELRRRPAGVTPSDGGQR